MRWWSIRRAPLFACTWLRRNTSSLAYQVRRTKTRATIKGWTWSIIECPACSVRSRKCIYTTMAPFIQKRGPMGMVGRGFSPSLRHGTLDARLTLCDIQKHSGCVPAVVLPCLHKKYRRYFGCEISPRRPHCRPRFLGVPTRGNATSDPYHTSMADIMVDRGVFAALAPSHAMMAQCRDNGARWRGALWRFLAEETIQRQVHSTSTTD